MSVNVSPSPRHRGVRPLALLTLAVLLPLAEGTAAQAPLESVLGRYRGAYTSLIAAQEINFDLRGNPDGTVWMRAETGRNQHRDFFGEYDPGTGLMVLRQGRGRGGELYFDAAQQRLIGELPSNASLVSVDLARDERRSRGIVEDYADAMRDWEESATRTWRSARGDRQWCYVFARWLRQYEEAFPEGPRGDRRIAALVLLSDSRFEPVAEKRYADLSRKDRRNFDEKATKCRREILPLSMRGGGQRGAWDHIHGALGRGNVVRFQTAVEQINAARAAFDDEVARLAALPASESSFWTAWGTTWENVSTIEDAQRDLLLWPADRASFERIRANVMSASGDAILAAHVDALLAAGDTREARWAMVTPPDIQGEAIVSVAEEERDEVREARSSARAARAAAARRARRAAAAADGQSRAASDAATTGRTRSLAIGWEEMRSFVSPEAWEREGARLDRRIGELEAAAVDRLAARVARLDQAESPFLEGARVAAEIEAERFRSSEPTRDLVSRLRARRASDLEAEWPVVAEALARAGNARALTAEVDRYFAVTGDRQLPRAAHLVGLANDRAHLLEFTSGWRCGEEPTNRVVPAGPRTVVPWLMLCAGVDDLLQRYMGAVRNDPGAEGEMGQFCGALADNGAAGGVAAAFCRMSGLGDIFRALFGSFTARLTDFSVTHCEARRTLAIDRTWTTVQDNRILDRSTRTIWAPDGGWICNARIQFDLGGNAFADAYRPIWDLFQAAASTYGTTAFFNDPEGIIYFGAPEGRMSPNPGPAAPVPTLDVGALSLAIDNPEMPVALAELTVQAALGRLVRDRRRPAMARLLTQHCRHFAGTVSQCLRSEGGGVLAYRYRWLLTPGAADSALETSLPERWVARYREIRASEDPADLVLYDLLQYDGVSAGPPDLDGLIYR